MKNVSKGFVLDILIDRMVDLEGSYHDFKSLCDERLVALEAKVLGINTDIKKLMQVCHISIKNSADSLEVLFRKISELREDQVYFFELMEKEHVAKGKGKKDAKDDEKGPTGRGLANWKKNFDAEKELLDMVERHKNQQIEVVNTLGGLN